MPTSHVQDKAGHGTLTGGSFTPTRNGVDVRLEFSPEEGKSPLVFENTNLGISEDEKLRETFVEELDNVLNQGRPSRLEFEIVEDQQSHKPRSVHLRMPEVNKPWMIRVPYKGQ